MISRALDSNNDLVVKNGRLAVVSDGAEVVQHVRTRILFYLGEWFANTNAGTPWFQQIFVKPVNLNDIESIIKTRIALTPGVLVLTAFAMDLDKQNRILKITYAAETIYGEINSEETFIND